MRLLVVEDDRDLNRQLVKALGQAGYAVDSAFDGEEGQFLGETEPYDAVILDLGLPKTDGVSVLEAWRVAGRKMPVLVLTARDGWSDKVRSFDAGADDYVTKPYSSRELVARIKAVLRRNGSVTSDSGTLHVGAINMDVDRHLVTINKKPVALPLKEFELLEFLMRNAGRVLTRMQLIDRVWGSDYVGDTKTLDVHIKRLRAKIEDDPANPMIIQTVRGLGYKMEL